MIIKFNIKCLFCENKKDTEFYTMPVEEEVRDGKVFSYTKYKVVCKKCNQKHLLTLDMIRI